MHFTYTEEIDRKSLNQGDLISRSPDVEAMLREVHPHYCGKPDYAYFIVLSQSCDLVRRGDKQCSSRYISIAAVRPLALALERELSSYSYQPVEKKLGFASSAHRPKAQQFVERLLNNNEPAHFFLEREASAGLGEDYCAFLHLSVAVKSELHYDTLLNAKLLQLSESFQHKLGYLVGNLYSRVGTEDWVPDHVDAERFEERVATLVEERATWIDKEIHSKVVKDLKKIAPEELSASALEAAVERYKKKKEANLSEAIDALAAVMGDLGIEGSLIEKAKKRFRNEPTFAALIK
jgi:hypothetical protein